MNTIKELLYMFFVIISIKQIQAEKRLRITIKESNLWSDNKILNYTELIDESEPSISFHFRVMKQLPDVDIHIEVNMRYKDNNKYYGQFNGTFSFCRIIGYKTASPITGLIFNHLNSFGNIPDSCPIKIDTYGMKKFWFGDYGSKLNLPEFDVDVHIQGFTTGNKESMKIFDNTYKAEAIYKEISGEIRRPGGLLSMLG